MLLVTKSLHFIENHRKISRSWQFGKVFGLHSETLVKWNEGEWARVIIPPLTRGLFRVIRCILPPRLADLLHVLELIPASSAGGRRGSLTLALFFIWISASKGRATWKNISPPCWGIWMLSHNILGCCFSFSFTRCSQTRDSQRNW